ncbi:hypothetical protein Tco_0897993 [Tanacetum coccineum]
MYLNPFYPRSFEARLSELGKKVKAMLKSAWTEKDQINNLLKESRFNTTAGNPVKKILLKLNLSDHRLFKDGGGVNATSDRVSNPRADCFFFPDFATLAVALTLLLGKAWVLV